MDCPSCQASNPAEASFCMKCGASLATTCPKCGTELPLEAQFCFKCGNQLSEPDAARAPARIEQYIPAAVLTKLEAARASGGMHGERRIITMLFCDVKGSTAAAEQLDPEEWAEIMNGAFEYLIAPVYRYEGTLARLMGDAILAFFGAPIAHEDDAERAVLAGLDILKDIGPYCDEVKQRWGLEFSVRVGVNTGLVVVGEVGTDMRLEYTAMGDAVNLAARMEQTAAPGTVQLTEDTYKLIGPLFEFEDLGALEVKGKSRPVKSYRVLGRKAEPGRRRGIEGLESPLVGRNQEMNKLRTALENLRAGRGQIVSVIGEAGLGKSRLVAEFRNTLVADGLLPVEGAAPGASTNGAVEATISWHEGRSLSYQTSTPYAPFADMLSRLFGLHEEHSHEAQYDLLKVYVAELLPDRADEIAPYIASMLDIKLTGDAFERVRYLQPPQLRERILHAVQDIFERMASLRPLVLLFEDLHWVDPTSLDLLERLVPLTDRASLLIIGLFRPVRQEPSWRFHELASRDYIHRYTEITLEPLDQDGSRELVANLLEVEDLPEKVRALITERAEGNPFFVEEVIRSLLDANLIVREDSHWRATREIESIAVPDTLAGVINARLDSIDDESRRVAQTASVIGREFHFEELLALHNERERVEVALSDLQRRELILEKSRMPHRVYKFKHVVTQETAYASLLLSRRRELHRQVAEFLEKLEADRVADIARHFLEAHEEARALPYLVDAAGHAASTYSTPEAIGIYKRAMQILETELDLQLKRRVYEGLGGALTLSFDVQGATENYQEMYEFGKAHGDFPMQVSALNKLGFISGLMQGQLQEAEQHLGDAKRLANESRDLPGLAECHMNYCYLLTSTGDFDDAVDHLSESAEIGRTLNLEEPRLFGVIHTANTLAYMTRFEEAWRQAQVAQQLAGEMKNQKWLAEVSVVAMSLYHLRNGDLDQAGQSAEEGMTLAARIGAADNESQGAYMLGQLAWMRGEYESAIAYQRQALEAGRAAGYPYLQASALCALGTVHLSISEKLLPQTTEYHTQALTFLELPLGAAMGGANWAEIGFCAMTAGNMTSADELFQRGLTTSTATKFLARPQLLVGAAFVAMDKGQIEDASKLVQEAREFAHERDMKHFYPMVALADGQVGAANGEMDQALESFAHAEGLALEMGMRPLVVQARISAVQILSAKGRASELETKRHEAQKMIDEIAKLFQDDNLRTMYIESAVRKLA